jgi:hypothetical protein
MNIRTLMILAAVAAAGGFVYIDYNSAESKLGRELKEIQQLGPDVQAPECFGKGLNAKLFAIGVERDRRSNAELDNDIARKGAIKHDCVRGNNPATVQRVVKALGASGIPTYAQVLKSCPVVKDEYPVYGCFALDALQAEGSKDAIAVLENELTDKDKGRRNIYEGALYRLMSTKGWATTAQVADRLPKESEWEAKELMLEYIRNHRDSAARPNLQAAYAAETDQQEKGLIRAALLEIDNPGKCVVTDEGRGDNGLCRYSCHDANRWFNIQKGKGGCALVQDVPKDNPADGGTPQITTASPVPAK